MNLPSAARVYGTSQVLHELRDVLTKTIIRTVSTAPRSYLTSHVPQHVEYGMCYLTHTVK